MNQLLRQFFAEAEDLIETLSADLQALREQRADGRAGRELVGRIFRHVHTLKGTAATFELAETSHLAHELETLLNAIRLGHLDVDEAVLDAFDESVLTLSETLNRAARGDASQAPPRELIERLQHLALRRAAPTSTSSLDKTIASIALPQDITRTLSDFEKQRLSDAASEGLRLYLVAISFDLNTFDERFRSLSEALAAVGELISKLPDLDSNAPERIGFRLIYATALTAAEVAAYLAPFGEALLTELNRAALDEPESKASEASARSASTDLFPTTIVTLSSFVRVELSELDELIAATNDLLKETTRALDLAQANSATRHAPAEDADLSETENDRARLHHRFIEIEERLIGLRMIPLMQMFRRAVRAGEIVARLTGKEIDFEMVGGDLRLDKWLADLVSDPLLHLLRNAVDHGIEPVAERIRAGKEARGHVRLEARAEGSRVVLRVSDDGRGVDLERVTRAAIEAGIVEEGAHVSKEKCLRLIFRPCFSTALSVSNISGRGVGLEVVEKAVERAGGELRVRSETGAGTTFEINLPSAFAVVSVFVVDVDEHRYCLDAKSVAEAGVISVEEIESDDSVEMMNWRGARIPLIHLRSLLALPANEDETNDKLKIIIADVAEHSTNAINEHVAKPVALSVDHISARTDVLVRSLGRHGARWRGIGGATELPDGTVALMLDLPRLLKMTGIISDEHSN